MIYSTIAGGLLATSAVAGEPTVAETPASTGDFATSVGVGYHTQYIWRGLNFGDDMADLSLEVTGSVAGFDLTAGAWYAKVFDVTGADEELDLYLEASKDLGFVTASVGYIFYHFFDDADDAQEVYFGLSKEIYGVDVSLTYYWDVETDNSGYTELGLEKSFNTGVSFLGEVDTAVAVGYLVEEGALSHLTASVSKTYNFKGFDITPYVQYSVELDDLETLAAGQKNELVAGVGFSYNF